MPHGIIFILDVLHGFNANIEMLPDEIQTFLCRRKSWACLILAIKLPSEYGWRTRR